MRTVFPQSMTTIINNGDSENRVDIAVLGDGYVSSELAKYATDVQIFLNGFFAQEPFLEYRNYFNVHRINVASNQSGASHPEQAPPVTKDTAFSAAYNCGGVQRSICVNVTRVLTVASSVLLPSERDIIIVIVNDSQYGGSGGTIAVASTNSLVVELVLHEAGHSFGLLGDEYGGPPPPSCSITSEPADPNITLATQRSAIKWNAWIDPSTPIPTTITIPTVPGLFQGAQYCDVGKYRPTFDSKMRTLNISYEQINTEQLIKRIYNFVSPIDSASPADQTLTLSTTQTQSFSVATPAPRTHGLNVDWFVDSQLTGSGTSYVLDAAGLSIGAHTVEAVVTDQTSSVRNDPSRVLVERRSWNITINASGTADFSLSANPRSTTISAGDAAEYSLTIAPVSGFNRVVALSCSGLPAGASCSFSPGSVELDGANPVSVGIRIDTTRRNASAPAVGINTYFLYLLLPVLLTGLLLNRGTKKRLIQAAVMIAFALVIVGSMGGCGSDQSKGTPAGNYEITITANSGAISHSTKIVLNVN